MNSINSPPLEFPSMSSRSFINTSQTPRRTNILNECTAPLTSASLIHSSHQHLPLTSSSLTSSLPTDIVTASCHCFTFLSISYINSLIIFINRLQKCFCIKDFIDGFIDGILLNKGS